MNRDALPDVLIASERDSRLTVWLGVGDGTLSGRRDTTIPLSSGGSYITTVDLDRDGRLDVVASSLSASNLAVLRGRGDGTFDTEVFSAAGVHAGVLAVDTGGSGWPAIVAAGYDQSVVSVIRNSNGSLQQEARLAAAAMPMGLAAADLNGDERPDVVACATGLHLLLAQPDGSLALGAEVPVPGTQALAAVTGDFNRDGKPDVAAAVAGDSVVVFLNTSR
ncbi:MAG: VCBS repeat-containing protein [Polyangia bacterium]